MIAGEINLQNFYADVLDREATIEGNGDKVLVKVLQIKDGNSKLVINLCFTEELFEKFARAMNKSNIVRATSIPESLTRR